MHPFLRSVKVASTVIDPTIRYRLARYIRSERRFWRRQTPRNTYAEVRGRRGYGALRAEFEAMTQHEDPEYYGRLGTLRPSM